MAKLVYNNSHQTDSTIDLVMTSRDSCVNRLKALGEDEGKNDDLIFNQDTGTIVTQGKEFGKGVYIKDADSPTAFGKDFGNIKAGAKFADFSEMSIGKILELAFGEREQFVDTSKLFNEGQTPTKGKRNIANIIPETSLGSINASGAKNLKVSITTNGTDGPFVDVPAGGYQLHWEDLDVVQGTRNLQGTSGIACSQNANGRLVVGQDGFSDNNLILNGNYSTVISLTYRLQHNEGYTITEGVTTKQITIDVGDYTAADKSAPTITPGTLSLNVSGDQIVSPINGKELSLTHNNYSIGNKFWKFNINGQEQQWAVTVNSQQTFKGYLTSTNVDITNASANVSNDLSKVQINGIPWMNRNDNVLLTIKQYTAGSASANVGDVYDSSGYKQYDASTETFTISTTAQSTVNLKGGFPIIVKIGDFSTTVYAYANDTEVDFTLNLTDINQRANYKSTFSQMEQSNGGIAVNLTNESGANAYYTAVINPNGFKVLGVQDNNTAIATYLSDNKLHDYDVTYSNGKLKSVGLAIAQITGKITITKNNS